MRSHPIR